jgi:L-threonylcarbamoyladenylate synthase
VVPAVDKLRNGGIVCFPTDTVYGLAVDAGQPAAVARLYQLKERSYDKPLVLFPPSHTSLFYLTGRLPAAVLQLIARFWPGPLTIVVPTAIDKPSCLKGATGGLGIRIPDHPVARALARHHGLFLGTTSANISGQVPVTQPQNLSPQLKRETAVTIEAGPVPSGGVSTVVEIGRKGLCILRPGAISQEDIFAAGQEPLSILFVCTANLCRSIMAELLFSQLVETHGKECRIRSAGICVFHSAGPPQAVRQTLRQRGVTRIPAGATPLTPPLIDSSDLILVMEERHKKHVVEHFPQAEHKTWLLREFTQGAREDVVDPISFAHNSYEQVVLELEEELDTLWERIFG